MNRWLNDLKRVIEINSYTANKRGVDDTGRVFEEWLRELGFECERFQRELIGDHLLFKSPVSGKRKRILLLGHIDTVFPPGKFEGFSEDDEWVYGPGVCDMKGGNIVALEALRYIYDSFGKIEDIDVLFVSDEETGSDDSRELTAKLAKDYDYCFVFEAAGRDMEVVVGRKGIGTFSIDITGKASHAGTSYSKGIDANLEAAIKLQKLVSLTDLEIGTTVNVGKIEGGIGANTISPSAKLLLEMRFANHQEKVRLLKALDEITQSSFVEGTTATLGGGLQRDVMEPNLNQERLIDSLSKICNEEIKSESRGGVSDANIVASCGVTTLDGWGPYGDGDHTPNERASKKSFVHRIEQMQKILTHHQKEGDFNE